MTTQLPLLSSADLVLLPGMVVPIQLDVEARLRRLLDWSRAHLAEQEVAERIRKELGADATADYRTRVEKPDLPPPAGPLRCWHDR